MKKMMKQMGMEDMFAAQQSDEQLYKELGISAGDVKGESADDIMKSLGLDSNAADQDMSDAALFKELDSMAQGPLDEGKEMVLQLQELKKQAVQYRDAGNKAKAMEFMKEIKPLQSRIIAHCAEHGLTEDQLQPEEQK